MLNVACLVLTCIEHASHFYLLSITTNFSILTCHLLAVVLLLASDDCLHFNIVWHCLTALYSIFYYSENWRHKLFLLLTTATLPRIPTAITGSVIALVFYAYTLTQVLVFCVCVDLHVICSHSSTCISELAAQNKLKECYLINNCDTNSKGRRFG